MPNARSIGEFWPPLNCFSMIIGFRKTVILAPIMGPAAVDDNPRRGPIARGTVSHYRPEAMTGSLESPRFGLFFSIPASKGTYPN